MLIEPSKNLLVLERIGKPQRSQIIMPDSSEGRFWMMKVIAFGEQVKEILGIQIKLGDTVICNPLPEVDKEAIDPEHPEYKLVSATHVLGRIV